MLLAIDVGNTNITLGVYHQGKLQADWRIRTQRDRTADEHASILLRLMDHRSISPAQIRGVAISNVVPTMTDALVGLARRYFSADPLVVGPDTDFGISIHYRPPGDVGADRLVNAIAAYHRYGGPAVVVDFGTSTTFDVIGASGDYLGGAIAPGIGISTDALFQRAARLYRVELTAPAHAIGTNTVEAMQSGIMFGFAGQVDAIVERIARELPAKPSVIATGGLADRMHKLSRTIEHVDPMLTLDGLYLLYVRNRGHE
ncbi:MAG: type III pantothenate kinase [Chthonomonadales bacterium]